MKKIGVLALQGAFSEHIAALHQLGVMAFPLRLPGDMKGIVGLVIPGGESTAISRLMTEYQLTGEIIKFVNRGLPVFGTCAGMIILAKKVSGLDGQPLGIIDIDVQRNAFGRQVDSFEADIEVPVLGQTPFHAVFIRAPRIDRVGQNVDVLASLPDGTAVAARQGNIVVAAFHPELTTDLRFHEYFLNIVEGKAKEEMA